MIKDLAQLVLGVGRFYFAESADRRSIKSSTAYLVGEAWGTVGTIGVMIEGLDKVVQHNNYFLIGAVSVAALISNYASIDYENMVALERDKV